MSSLSEALKKIGGKFCTSGTAFSSDNVAELVDCIADNYCGVPKVTLGTAFIARYEGTTPIYRVYGEQDITSFTEGNYIKEITYDASEKRIRACGCSASVNFGTSPQTWEITSNEGNNLVVFAEVIGGGGNSPKITYKVKDRQSTPTATTGILYYWYEYTLVD